MSGVELEQYLKDADLSQDDLAKVVGLSQSAISKMLRVDRRIYVHTLPDGQIQLHEIKVVAPKDAVS